MAESKLGRPEGSSQFAETDEPILGRMAIAVATGTAKSAWDAAGQFQGEAETTNSQASTRKRLHRKFKKREEELLARARGQPLPSPDDGAEVVLGLDWDQLLTIGRNLAALPSRESRARLLARLIVQRREQERAVALVAERLKGWGHRPLTDDEELLVRLTIGLADSSR